MDIKVIGTGCNKCHELYDNTKRALSEVAIDANLSKVEDLIEIVKLGVMSVPSLMIDGKLVVTGQVASKDKILKILKNISDMTPVK